jgi:hypothetical protein
MKFKGNKLSGLREVIEVIPIHGHDIGFVFKAVIDEAEFEKMSPRPEPPMVKTVKTGLTEPNFKDPGYIKSANEWGSRHTNWMFLTSMKDTPDFEWETVKLEDAGTWHNWISELKEAGFTDADINRLLNAFAQAQGLDDKMVQEARMRFLATRQQVATLSNFQPVENLNTQSGEPVKDSQSDRQE